MVYMPTKCSMNTFLINSTSFLPYQHDLGNQNLYKRLKAYLSFALLEH